MLTHRDRLVVLSFMTSPYQNTSQNEAGDFISSNNNDLLYEKTHLVEKFYPGGFDEMDVFDFETHEKLEIESQTTTHATFTNRMTSLPVNPNTGHATENNRKSHERTKSGNRQNGKGGGSRKNAGRKDSNVDAAEIPRPNNRKEKPIRRGDDVDEKLELKPNKKFDFERINEFEVSTVFEVTKNAKKPVTNQAKVLETVDEAPSQAENGNGKNLVKDSNIHIVRPMEGIVPSTPVSTDSKIIEIKPSGGRNSAGIKKIKRFSGNDDETNEDEGELQQNEPTENNRGNGGVQIEAASLIGAVPANISTASVHLNGFAGCIQKYLHVDKEIGMLCALLYRKHFNFGKVKIFFLLFLF